MFGILEQCFSGTSQKTSKSLEKLEAATGFEPVNNGFADHFNAVYSNEINKLKADGKDIFSRFFYGFFTDSLPGYLSNSLILDTLASGMNL